MAFMFHVSLQNTDKELVEWIRERQRNNELSLSLVFRDAMKDKKKEWEIVHSANTAELQKTIERLRHTLEENNQKFNDFVDERDLSDDWIAFFTSYKEKNKKQNGYTTQIKSPKIQKIEQEAQR